MARFHSTNKEEDIAVGGSNIRVEKTPTIADGYKALITGIGEDVDRHGLKKTPERAAKAFKFLTKGYRENIKDIVNDAVFDVDSDGMVLLKDINICSLCEHHILPFIGKVSIAYMPNKRVIGLSKIVKIVEMYSRRLQIQERLTEEIARAIDDVIKPHGVGVYLESTIVEMYSRRLQIQERLTEEIARAIDDVIKPHGVGVYLESTHMCMVMRGVQNTTVTSAMLGIFKEDANTRQEFLSLIKVN